MDLQIKTTSPRYPYSKVQPCTYVLTKKKKKIVELLPKNILKILLVPNIFSLVFWFLLATWNI